jgi:hypothetical protein
MTHGPLSLPRIAGWRSSLTGAGSLGLWDYLGQEGGATLAVGFAGLFWPSFVEVRGCVLLSERYDAATFEEWWAKLDGDVRGIEAVVNHVHLWDLFDPEAERVPDEALVDLAEVLARCWRAALADRYPGRSFDVAVTADEAEYGPTITISSTSAGS